MTTSSEAIAAEVPLNDRPHVLYRMFDASDVLIYVGITVHVPGRFDGHRHDKPWWPEIAVVRMEHFPNRATAADAERTAIRTENPKYNIALRSVTRERNPAAREVIPPSGRPVCLGEKTGMPDLLGYVDRATAAAYFGIGVQTFDNLRQKNADFPETEYAGRTPLWRLDDLDDWRTKHPARKKPGQAKTRRGKRRQPANPAPEQSAD